MSFALQRSLVLSSMEASTSSPSMLSTCLWSPRGHLRLVTAVGGVPEKAQHSEGAQAVRQIRRSERRLDGKFSLASVCTKQRTRRSCTAKVFGLSGELRPVLLKTRPWVAFAVNRTCPLPHRLLVLKRSSRGRIPWASFGTWSAASRRGWRIGRRHGAPLVALVVGTCCRP